MNILEEYQETKLALEILSQELEEKKEALIKFLHENNGKGETANAKFSLRKSVSYRFSEKVEKYETDLKLKVDTFMDGIKETKSAITQLKANEVEDGVAEVLSETFTPVMIVKKLKGVSK